MNILLPLFSQLPQCWHPALRSMPDDRIEQLNSFIAAQRKIREIYPPEKDMFAAFAFSTPESVKVLLLGQDPYHEPGQAHGLAFSVPDGVKVPPSLRNIFKELHADLGCYISSSGNLISWAKQGVLLLNTVLTVQAHQANSHRKQGWEEFTDGVIRLVNEVNPGAVFLLWGKPAQSKLELIDQDRHRVLCAPHPSPLSAHRGFFGSRPFSRANAALKELGRQEINWQLTEDSGNLF